MPTGPHFRTSLLAARERLRQSRSEIRKLHEKNLPGEQICGRLADAVDQVVIELFHAALHDLDLAQYQSQIALVPHGGYGRRILAPFSDVDLMVLYRDVPEQTLSTFLSRLMQDLYDIGLEPGHSVRTPQQALALAREDVTIFTSLVESRFLCGEQLLYRDFREMFAELPNKRWRSLYEAIVQSRREERVQYGETVYLLNPNIKRSRGGLRDIQLMRWIGFVKFGESDPNRLLQRKILSKFDFRLLSSGQEFLLQLRNEMHFHADRAADVLNRTEQVRLAEKFGYRGTSVVLPVEEFMKEYFFHTTRIRNLVSRFVESVRPQPTVQKLFRPLFSHQVENDYRVTWRSIEAKNSAIVKLKDDLEEVLRLADLASLYDKRIDHATWETVCRAAPNYERVISPEIAARFLSLLAQPTQLAQLLRKLHELGVLEIIIPAMKHARCLLQFNEYHKYTVDEHSLRAVAEATRLQEDQGLLGDAYRAIENKRTLHLALLLHDLGKGFSEDHSEKGLKIARETCRRLNMESQEAETVGFLVHQHLLMSHLAFRRDTSDMRLLAEFARTVGSPERLQMLFVLTCADLAAVGPGVLNRWKIDVLSDLYFRARRFLAGPETMGGRETTKDIRRELREIAAAESLSAEAIDYIDQLSENFLRSHSQPDVISVLEKCVRIEEDKSHVWATYQSESNTMQYTVLVTPGHGQGMFSRLTGTLTSKGCRILSAEVDSLADDIVIDRFVVEDGDFQEPPPEERIAEMCRQLQQALFSNKKPKFRQLWQARSGQDVDALSDLTTEVRFDNSTSQHYTILDVFAFDRSGVLYRITDALFELNLSIRAARIGTYLDQVVDVFYVADQDSGEKITDPQRLEQIRSELLRAIDCSQ